MVIKQTYYKPDSNGLELLVKTQSWYSLSSHKSSAH